MSEIALLRQQIEFELVAMRRGLTGLASGRARHDFIHASMSRIGTCQDHLAHHLGDNTATMMVCQIYIDTMEQVLPQE
ncbi:hypothetical protein [Dictyobacter arantiisoli]|uniref:PhoU domain-containing protein n=1 Tax=Dictyobacter arantiisoli TaxID=2014874 RepID=A0A5A5TF35_9CHLR|nr:hypothetical protein [Dictyobacter arantiisoli]GCF09619.1 hypothetical protein KDI_31830 [Dictyobacter arantiisoli]